MKEDWIPNSKTTAVTTPSSVAPQSSVSLPVSTDTKDTTVVTDEKPFTLQSYADKWKVYHENKEKMNEGKPKEASHIDAVNALPVIGK